MEREAVSTEGTCSDDDEAHGNPWKPCQPGEDAKEWNGIEGIGGAPSSVGLSRPATPSVTDKPVVAGEERTGSKALGSPWLSTHICRSINVPGGVIESMLVEMERQGRSGASLRPDVAPF